MSSQNQLMKNNYHTHTYLCNHATGTVDDYVKKAIELGFDTIGISDHGPMDEFTDRSLRMVPKEYPLYLKQCEKARKEYQDKINVLRAVEIEYLPNHDDYYKRLLLNLDYLALGQHYIIDETSQNNLRSVYRLSTIKHLESYADIVIEGMKSGCFAFLCHPDVMLINVHEFTKEIEQISDLIIEASIRYDVPLEINTNGIRKKPIEINGEKRYRYPRKEFWQRVKKKNAKVIVSSDAHQPNHLYDKDVERAYAFADELGIAVEEELDL